MSQLADEFVESQGEEKKMGKKVKATKITIRYESDQQVDIWFEGPHTAAGMVLDVLLHKTSSDLEVQSIIVVPNAQDVPRTERVG